MYTYFEGTKNINRINRSTKSTESGILQPPLFPMLIDVLCKYIKMKYIKQITQNNKSMQD